MHFGSISYPVLWLLEDQTISLCDMTVNHGFHMFAKEAAALEREGAHFTDESSVQELGCT
jgi:hypothetical protein